MAARLQEVCFDILGAERHSVLMPCQEGVSERTAQDGVPRYVVCGE